MKRRFLKKARRTVSISTSDVQEKVRNILFDIEHRREDAATSYAKNFDEFSGNIILSSDEILEACSQVSDKIKNDIQFSYENVRKFAEAQKATLSDFEIEIVPGFTAGQKYIPCNSVGCYIPGGRYSHVASAIMTVATAKVSQCAHITACSPPTSKNGINPAVIYTADLCGADSIMVMGGAHAIASMAFGLFGLPEADILVGPGNQYVAEAKRQLYGKVGLDMVAGPYISRNLKCLSVDGRLAIIAVQGGIKDEVNFANIMVKRQTITGSTLRPQPSTRKAEYVDSLIKNAWEYLDTGKIKPIIQKEFPFRHASEAHRALEKGDHVGKFIMKVS